MKITELKALLKQRGARLTHKNKANMITTLEQLKWYDTFTWRTEQKIVIDAFNDNKYKVIIVNGTFGSGKSLMLLGILFKGINEGFFLPKEVIFTAFNVCVKNEIRKKISDLGIRGKVDVRTFDSIVYRLCHIYECPNLDQPNYEGRRKFLYNIIEDIIGKRRDRATDFDSIKFVFVDECQDLEKQALSIFTVFFPNARFLLVGDVFQSIQKEPKESILWTQMNTETNDEIFKVFMTETPRVPINILNQIKSCLISYYPELSSTIQSWKTANTTTDGKFEFKKFISWKSMHDTIVDFTQKNGAKDSMVLTFSSSITVSGNLGDIARVRTVLREKNIPVNLNHKRMEDGKLFLSTSNSSKGLERKHVLIILTFPLEKAFSNFSGDMVMNLITVALSRAKESVVMYVPSIIDKSTIALNHYSDSPVKANKEEWLIGPLIERPHSVTEMIKLSIIKYQTRIDIKEHVKFFKSEKFVTDTANMTRPSLSTDEERCLIGIFVENLITTTWSGSWPKPLGTTDIEVNIDYSHCSGRILKLSRDYFSFISGKSPTSCSDNVIFSALYLYSKLHIAIDHKLFVSIPQSEVEGKLRNYWTNIKYTVIAMKPVSENLKIEVQRNVRMPYLTGIVDMIATNKSDISDYNEQTIYEIKASCDYKWEDDAMTQALSYALMTGKTYSKIVLINPFRNAVLYYNFRPTKINTIRHYIYNDCAIYNITSYLCKHTSTPRLSIIPHKIISGKTMFIGMDYDSAGILFHLSVFELFSPTRIDKVIDLFAHSDCVKTPQSVAMSKQALESTLTPEDLYSQLSLLIDSNPNYIFYSYGKYEKVSNHVLDLYPLFKCLVPEQDFTFNLKETCSNVLGYSHVNDEKFFFTYDFDSAFFRTLSIIVLASRICTFI